MSAYAKQRARDELRRLAGQDLDLVSLWQEASVLLTDAVPHDAAPCWFTLDPASLLVTSHYQPEVPELPPEWLAHEYYEDDAHKMADVARSARGISTLHEATGGDPRKSAAWNLYMQPHGVDQEVLVALRTPSGHAWGMLALYREPDRPRFDTDELHFLRGVSAHLAEGARRGLLLGEAADPEGPDSPGLVVLYDDWTVESLTPGAERWLADLPDGDWSTRGRLPPAVLAVAGRALRASRSPDATDGVPLARVRSRSGVWMVLHGAVLMGAGAPRVAVIIEPAYPARITPLLMTAYKLTEREQEITQRVLKGDSTTEVASRLAVSAHTVQQHLKSVFEKTGVRSRRELVAKVFFAHYEPRLRDNERRTATGRPVRGGPMEPTAEP